MKTAVNKVGTKALGQRAGSFAPLRSGLLQRKCGCGGPASGSHGSCEECKKKKDPLQRRAANASTPATVPSIVHEVLASSGQRLDGKTRSYMEPRFGHDFSRVRVHTDAKAAESARAVNALAYTSGNNVVFDAGQFSPQSSEGRKLLAHELAHVVQQGPSISSQPQSVSDANDSSEREADHMADKVVHGAAPHSPVPATSARLMRKLNVLKPADPIPNPDGKGLKQTNAEAVEGYLKTMAQGSGVKVDRSSGDVDVSTAYCPGFAGGFMAGAKAGFGLFKGIPLLNVVLGAPAALIGGLIGGIAGLFGGKSSAASSSATPTGSNCLCDILASKQPWKIELNDEFPDKQFPHPVTLDDQRIVTFSPNNPKIAGAATTGGQLENYEPWLMLAHELCGHAWLEVKNMEETTQPVPHAFRDDSTGKMVVDPVSKDAPGPHGHELAVERENLIRKEHGMAPRGWRLKDPFCGESFLRDKAAPQGPAQFFPDKGFPGFNTLLEQCQFLRDQLPESKDKKFRIDEPIP